MDKPVTVVPKNSQSRYVLLAALALAGLFVALGLQYTDGARAWQSATSKAVRFTTGSQATPATTQATGRNSPSSHTQATGRNSPSSHLTPEKAVLSPGSSRKTSPVLVGVAPPSMLFGWLNGAEAEFVAEPLDREWSARKRTELIDSLSIVKGDVSSAQIDCKSSTCRVELRSIDPATYEEWSERTSLWLHEVISRTGFLGVDSEFFPDQFTSLSYFTMKMPSPAEVEPTSADDKKLTRYRRVEAANQQGPGVPRLGHF